MDAVSSGLNKAITLTPSSGYLEALGSLSRLKGPEATAELGWHINPQHSLFARGFANHQDQGIGVGWRWEF